MNATMYMYVWVWAICIDIYIYINTLCVGSCMCCIIRNKFFSEALQVLVIWGCRIQADVALKQTQTAAGSQFDD